MSKKSKTKPTLLLAITKASWGGAQKYVYDLAQGFRHEYEVHVLCGANEFTGDNLFVSKLEDLGILVHQIPTLRRDVSLRDEWRSVRNIFRVLKQVEPDIVHLNSSKMAIIGSIAAFVARVPIRVYTVHGFPFLDTSRSSSKNTIIKYLTRLGLLFVNNIITISHREHTIVRGWWESRSKAHLVYNGLVSGGYLPRNQALEQLLEHAPQAIQNKVAQGATILGSVAELRPNKGVHILLQALAQLADDQDFVYIHIGTGEEEAYLRTLVQEYDLEEQVYFAGFVSGASQYIAAFDIFVLASLQEGTPYVLTEAGFARACVVATDVGAVDEMVEDGVSGLVVPPADSKALNKAISTLRDNPELRAQYAQALHKHIEERFDYDTMIAKTKAVYES